MSIACAAKSCRTHEEHFEHCELMLFPFPEDVEGCRQWAFRCNRVDLLKRDPREVHVTEYLCERHFEESALDRSGSPILKPKAMPTLFDHENENVVELPKTEDFQNENNSGIVVIPCVVIEGLLNSGVPTYSEDTSNQDGDSENVIVIGGSGDTEDEDSMPLNSATLIIGTLADLAARFCRVCANESEELIPVFQEEGIELRLYEKIQWHLPIEVKEDDTLPVRMCTSCISMLNSWDDFIQASLVADKKLRKIFKDDSKQNEEELKQNEEIEGNALQRYVSLRDSPVVETVQVLQNESESPERFAAEQQESTEALSMPEIPNGVVTDEHATSCKEEGEEDGNETHVETLKIENVTDEMEGGNKMVDLHIETLSTNQENTSAKKKHRVTVPAETVLGQNLLKSALEEAIPDNAQDLEGEPPDKQETNKERANDIDMKYEAEEEDDVDEETLTMIERRRSRLREFKCDICSYKAPRKSALVLHHRRKHPPQYSCSYCDKKFSNVVSKKLHERSHMQLRIKNHEQTVLVCEYCGKAFRSTKTLKEHHISAHSEQKPYQCDKCGKNYGSLSSLDIHKSTHSTETPCLCDLCGKTFKHVSNLRSHKRSHLDDMIKNRQICPKCGKGFRSRFHLSEHMNVHNGVRPYSCSICGKRFHKKIQLRQHGSAHSGTQPYKCPICGVKFNRRGNMTQHVKRHEQERKFTCRVCNESFPTLGAVLTHRKKHTEFEVERSIHLQSGGDDADQVAFKCEICGKLLAKKETLNIHMRTHTGEKLFECSVCGKKLSNKGTLAYHMRSFHTGERPHTCQFCGDGFISKEARLVHERIHTGEKPFECLVCGMAFRCSSNLAQHSRVHSDARPYECPYCEKKFQRKGALVVHIRTHTGERPYSCDLCGRAFTQKNDMLKHRRTHTHEKPFKCDLCSEMFSQKHALTTHSLVHALEQEPTQPTQTVVINTADPILTYPEISVPVFQNAQTIILHKFQ